MIYFRTFSKIEKKGKKDHLWGLRNQGIGIDNLYYNQAAAGNWLKRMERAAERTSQKLRKNAENCKTKRKKEKF